MLFFKCKEVWTLVDQKTLVANMKNNLPAKDVLKYHTTIPRLDWTKVKFNNHSVEDCKTYWATMQKKVSVYFWYNTVSCNVSAILINMVIMRRWELYFNK